jgi:hypothetical protein
MMMLFFLRLLAYLVPLLPLMVWQGPTHPVVVIWNAFMSFAAAFPGSAETFEFYFPHGHACALDPPPIGRCPPIMRRFPIRIGLDGKPEWIGAF